MTATKRKPPRGASRGERSGRVFAPPPIPRDVADDARCLKMDHVRAWGRVRASLVRAARRSAATAPAFRAPPVERLALGGGVLSIRATGHRGCGTICTRTTHHRVPDWRARVPGGGRSQGAGDGRALGQSRTTRGRLPQTPTTPPSFRPRRLPPRAGRARSEAAVLAYNENLRPRASVDDSDSEPDADAGPVSASAERRRRAPGSSRVRPGRTACATCRGKTAA